MSEGRSASFLHAFVIFFFSALLVNILYPTFLLRTRHVFYQRNFSFIADTVLDVIYAAATSPTTWHVMRVSATPA